MTNELIDQVENDPDLNSAEKESSVTFLGDEKRFTIFSAKRTIVKSLLEHDNFEVKWLQIDKNGKKVRVDDPENVGDSTIYSVSGTMPIGCLTIKSKPRSNNHQSSVVNSETIDADAFQ